MAAIDEKITVNFEGIFTPKQKARIEKFIRNQVTGVTDLTLIKKLFDEYTNSRDFILDRVTSTQINCIMKTQKV